MPNCKEHIIIFQTAPNIKEKYVEFIVILLVDQQTFGERKSQLLQITVNMGSQEFDAIKELTLKCIKNWRQNLCSHYYKNP